jgi:hypothetical protein
MNRTLQPTRHTSSPVRTVPRPTGRKVQRRPSGDGGPNTVVDRISCAVCGFAGVDIQTQPGANFPTAYTTQGSTYVWASPADAITSLDKSVTPVPAVGAACPFCGATNFLSGSRGSGNAV